MNRKNTVSTVEAEQNNGQFEVKRNHKADIIAALVCVLIALLVWLVLMNGVETDFVELVVVNKDPAYKYELSVTQVEVEGSAVDLRKVTEIYVKLPEGLKPGVYRLDDIHGASLLVPEGISLARTLNLTVTVTEAP